MKFAATVMLFSPTKVTLPVEVTVEGEWKYTKGLSLTLTLCVCVCVWERERDREMGEAFVSENMHLYISV